MRAWPFPYMKLMHPFMIGGGITFYAFYKIQDALCESEQYANDVHNPKNPMIVDVPMALMKHYKRCSLVDSAVN
ncbi:hypothetical protein GGI26_001899 [Coemansia sp. RSA 1358]|uniref:Uncharacterized protein n=1 Tax=Coemansia umbellata TaxID=1424467 RepID=A0ABQ8PDZ3_9FUNG|nr:hypothetical protein BX070DRAFT_255050 [Coemansia spiralis]KAJ1987037.1 hypothetical protein EDC05_006025 [Coemansia umbellata]KAJ2623885.1 hypothetical protein GGI26_001899 [Coemansia sp. RSA 1358]